MAIKGIDVSKWQGTIDWAKVKRAGVGFAIIRAGFGREVSQKDTKFEANYAGAKAQGIPVGAYWYSYATTVEDVKREAAACLTVIKGKQFEYPIWFDQEYEPGILALTNAQRTAICKAFCEELEKAGCYTGIYCSTDFMNTKLDYKALADYDHWAAQYGTKCTSKHPYGIWQYSSTGTVSGIAGNVDMDYGLKDYPSIIKAAGLNGYGKAVAPTPPSPALSTYKIGPMSAGDVRKLEAFAERLGLPLEKV